MGKIPLFGILRLQMGSYFWYQTSNLNQTSNIFALQLDD